MRRAGPDGRRRERCGRAGVRGAAAGSASGVQVARNSVAEAPAAIHERTQRVTNELHSTRWPRCRAPWRAADRAAAAPMRGRNRLPLLAAVRASPCVPITITLSPLPDAVRMRCARRPAGQTSSHAVPSRKRAGRTFAGGCDGAAGAVSAGLIASVDRGAGGTGRCLPVTHPSAASLAIPTPPFAGANCLRPRHCGRRQPSALQARRLTSEEVRTNHMRHHLTR